MYFEDTERTLYQLTRIKISYRNYLIEIRHELRLYVKITVQLIIITL